MEISVEHELHYKYSAPVYLEPQTIYLSPRISPYQQLKNFKLEISPSPSLLSKNIDAEGNIQYVAHFAELTDSLHVKSSVKISSAPFNVFEFLVYPFELKTMPFEYSELSKNLLAPYLFIGEKNDSVVDYAQEVLSASGNDVQNFLSELVRRISRDFIYEYRETGEPLSPSALLKNRKGTCRDYANLCIEVCRRSGIAARFVSGYFHGDPEQDRHLHGWVEVYLPASGWRGIDPTQGVWADEHYVALAASAEMTNIAPVNGTYRGNAKSEMEVSVSILAS